MTEKRYSLVYYADNGGAFIKNNETGTEWYHGSRASLLEIVNELNGLAEENEQLKHDATVLICSNQEYRKENEQLKNKIDVLEDDNETYHKSLEKINLYAKRFIPTKCTNEFKDCKTNRYYWLDHEGNFEGCLELLNLLDCENEELKFENRQLKGRLMEYEEQIERLCGMTEKRFWRIL